MTVKYLEFINGSERILIKIDSIKEVFKSGDTCIVNGISIKANYEDVKALINSDDRRVIFDDAISNAIRTLIRDSV